jgi:glyoxylase-like metal-dependent hydrolase (beta-lactamase superfamily II)
MKRHLLLPGVILIAVGSYGQQNFDTVNIRPLKIAERIYMLTGSGGNIGVLTGKDGILMIDDQFAPLSEKIKNAIASLDPTGIRFLINTHIHGDHSGGNENFKRMGISIFAHDMVRERMMKEQLNKALNRTTPPREMDAWPVVTFSDKISFHLNDEDIDAFHFNSAHTDGDVVIHFRKANVFHTGDIFVRYGYPFIDVSSGGGINGFITYLDKLLPLMDENSKIIPGHGALATKDDVRIFRDKLKDIRDQVAAALKKGKKVEDIPSMGITDKYDAEWGKGFLKGKDFLLMLAESLKTNP